MLGFPYGFARDFSKIWAKHVGASVSCISPPTILFVFSMGFYRVFECFLPDLMVMLVSNNNKYATSSSANWAIFFRQIWRKKQKHLHFCNFWESKNLIFAWSWSAHVLQQRIPFVCMVGSSMYLRIAISLTYVLLLRLVRCPVPFKVDFSVLLAQLWALPLVWLDERQLFFVLKWSVASSASEDYVA